jgi:hypothetical protein
MGKAKVRISWIVDSSSKIYVTSVVFGYVSGRMRLFETLYAC